ncbi:hypothetical protein GCM10027435_16020 [Haloparvum alkalitolerans]|uniref:hypothetical protein n=1 Tax=Haloparvum alkalitolerans TaxID=1042953 RepID=UPI003CF22F89
MSAADSSGTGDSARPRYRGRDRRRGALSVSDERLLVGDANEGGDPVAVSLARVEEVTHRRVDWYLVLLGLAVVAFGLASVPRNPVAGAAFALAGLGSLLVTWRRRDRVRVRVRGRPKPLTLYPAEPERFLSAVGAALDAARAEGG